MSVFKGLVPVLQGPAEQLRRLALAAGLNPKVTSVRRTRSEQTKLYLAWKAGRSIYPAAYPGTSKHEHGRAFDMTVSNKSALSALGQIWERAGGRWGGRFKDPIHFEI